MKKIYIIATNILVLFYFTMAMADFEVSEIYTQSEGNNKYEAQIKAHNHGMQRAFFMVVDNLGINQKSVSAPGYHDLCWVFSVSNTKNVTQNDNFYEATVTYQYNLDKFGQILLKYGDQSVKDRFYEYLIIPILRQKNILTIWNGKQEWSKKWANNRNILEQSKLFYPRVNDDLIKKINEKNILHLSHLDFLNIFPSILFKKVLLVFCEYFTDIKTGLAVMDIKYITIDSEGKNSVSLQYPLNNMQEATQLIEKILIKTIKEYGRFDANDEKKDVQLFSDNIINKDVLLNNAREDDSRVITMDFEAFNEVELKKIEEKLALVKDIENFTITHNYDERYKVVIVTKIDDYALAENFYFNGLSFKTYGNLYNLVNIIKEGG